MRRATILGASTLAVGAVVAALAWWSAGPERPPDIVVVIGCTVRVDQTTPYGGPDATTPFLAELAAAGTTFDDALGASTWTRESAAALLTGQHALTLGLPEPGPSPSRRTLPEQALTLAEVLRDAGYTTLGQTANPNLNRLYGIAQGFGAYGDAAAKGFALHNRRSGQQVVADALAMLDARPAASRDAPVYLQVVLIDAHTPREVPPREARRFGRDVPPLVRDYRATLRRLDDAIRALDAGLRDRGIGDDALFVFVTDHGEGLKWPPHHRGGHGKATYPSTARVAWILRGPGVPAGRRVAGLASQVDVLPTVLGLAGIDAPDVAGSDLAAAVVGRRAITGRDRAFTSSWFEDADVAAIWTEELQCQRDDAVVPQARHALRRGCFRRRTDPEFREPPFEDAALLEELALWRDARVAEWRTVDVVEADPDAATAAQLEALGYTD